MKQWVASIVPQLVSINLFAIIKAKRLEKMRYGKRF